MPRLHTFVKVFLLQCAALVFAALLAWGLWGSRGGLSALCGGLAVLLPSALFAWRLALVTLRGSTAHVPVFLAGELIKLVSMVGLLILLRLLWPGAQWGAVMLGLILVLQMNFFALLVN